MSGRKHFFSPEPGLVPWWTADRPTDWPAQFGRRAPLEVEIGTGTGEYLSRQAARRPDWDFVGLELKYERLVRTLARAKEAGLGNVRGLWCDARMAFARLLPSGSVWQITALFPDPWPKDRHEARRLFSGRFLTRAASRLVPGGAFRIVTDHGPYADWIEAQARGAGFDPLRGEVSPALRTRFEDKWVAGGQRRFHELHWVVDRPPDPEPPVEEAPVIRVLLPHFVPDSFAPAPVRGTVSVAFKDFLHDPQRARAMVRAVVIEGELSQQVWFTIARDRRGWWLATAEGCPHLPTPGVHAAFDALRRAADPTHHSTGP